MREWIDFGTKRKGEKKMELKASRVDYGRFEGVKLDF